MAVKSGTQLQILDISDGYSCNATLDSHVLSGTVDSVNGTQSITSTYSMKCGRDARVCSIDVSKITKPTGVSITSDNGSPNPTLTFSFNSSVKKGGTIDIPVYCASDDITIVKTFSYEVAYKGSDGNGIVSTTVEYAKSASGTTAPASGWGSSIPNTVANEFLWSKTTTVYKTGDPTVSYSVSRTAADGTSVTVQSTKEEYAVTSSATAPTTGWSTTKPTSVPQGQYLHYRLTVTFSDQKQAVSTTSTYQGKDGAKGDDGADAITLNVLSSNGFIFRNSKIATTLTCEVYKGGRKLSNDEIKAEGTIKWYLDGNTTPVATGITLTVSAGDVFGAANYVVQLEG